MGQQRRVTEPVLGDEGEHVAHRTHEARLVGAEAVDDRDRLVPQVHVHHRVAGMVVADDAHRAERPDQCGRRPQARRHAGRLEHDVRPPVVCPTGISGVLLWYLARSEDEISAQLERAFTCGRHRVDTDQQPGGSIPYQLNEAQAHEAQPDDDDAMTGDHPGAGKRLLQIRHRLADGQRRFDVVGYGQDVRCPHEGHRRESRLAEPGHHGALHPVAGEPSRRDHPADDLVTEPDGFVRCATSPPRGQV